MFSNENTKENKKIRVLMLGRSKLLQVGGGDKVQIVNTAKELEKLGIEVDIKTDMNFNPRNYDLVHVFQLDWTPETYFYAKKVKDENIPLILSPIHHNVSEVKRFDDEYVFDYRRISKLLFKDQFHRDVFKNVYRSIFNPLKAYPTLYSVFYGFKKMQKETLEISDAVLVQTNAEVTDLENTFDINIKDKSHLVINGVGKTFLNIENNDSSNKLPFKDYILCVGRLEPRKNQLSIIKAVEKLRNEENIDFRLVFVGSIAKLNHIEYSLRLRNLIKNNNWIMHVSQVPYEDMPAFYRFAKVGISASWFETTGLTSLEALFCGCNAVASGDRAKEYLGNLVSYCDPGNIDSIKNAIKKEYFATRPSIPDIMKNELTWENAAKKTLFVYEKILGSNKNF